MSITTKQGDEGNTRLSNGESLSKGELRVEAAGSIDELRAAIGCARAFLPHDDFRALLKERQRELFRIGAAITTKPGGRYPVPEISAAMVSALDAMVNELEATPGLIADWTVSGDLRESALLDVARTVCRRAERNTVRLNVAGAQLQKNVGAYLNRLSDVLWLIGRVCDVRAGVESTLRDAAHPGPPWSEAW